MSGGAGVGEGSRTLVEATVIGELLDCRRIELVAVTGDTVAREVPSIK